MSKFKFTVAEMDLVMDTIGNYIHNGLQTSQLFDRIESLLSEREESETAQLRAENERLRAELKAVRPVVVLPSRLDIVEYFKDTNFPDFYRGGAHWMYDEVRRLNPGLTFTESN